MSEVPAPINETVTIANIVIDGIVTGAGPDVIIANCVAQAPWLAYPIISKIFSWIVNSLANKIDTSIKQHVDVIIIRFQNNALQKKYDDLINQVRTQKELTDAELAKARAIIDAYVNRTRSLRHDDQPL